MTAHRYDFMEEVDPLQEHNDFHYASEGEWDQAAASELGANRPDLAWICTDRDVWHANPYYVGPPQRHPEDDSDMYEQWAAENQDVIREAAGEFPISTEPTRGERVTYINGDFDDIPF